MTDSMNTAFGLADEAESPLLKPKLSLQTITFSDGTTLSFDDDDIVVFVGPNNAGKSAALRELEAWIARSQEGVVVKSAELKKTGSAADLMAYLQRHAQKSGTTGSVNFGGIGFSIHEPHISFFDRQNDRHPVAPFFAKRLATEDRISGSNPAPALALFQDPPTHPIHMLLMDETLATEISGKFKHAFGMDLTVFRAGGSSYPLYTGQKPVLAQGKDELSREFVTALQQSNVRLEIQGDGMRSFATVILHVLAAETHSIQFLDEPEAFLHPPQARLLGRYIAESRKSQSQLFIATHSSDILDGLIEGGSNKVRIVRLRRDGDINRVKELSKEATARVAKDTLTRFSRVFDGIFFEHVIICESDADCMFYQFLLNLPDISGNRRPDVLFVHTAGKHRMAKLVSTLRSLDVPVSVIADIDIINDEGVFKKLFEQLGGEWAQAQPHWLAVSKDVVAQRPSLNTSQVVGMIEAELDGVKGTGDFPQEKEMAIKRIFKSVSAWSSLKQSGRSAIRSGQPTSHYNQLDELCSNVGLWIVPEGEIEGFCRSIGSHGPAFVEKVLEEKDVAQDVELKAARDFVAKIWGRASPA